MVQQAQPVNQALEDLKEHHRTSTGQSHRKVLMWTFLGTECMFFGSLIATFLIYHNNVASGPDREHAFESLTLVSIMAFVLLASSFTMVLALAAARRGDEKMMRVWLLVTAFFGLFFIGAQGYEFWHFTQEGLTPHASLFGASFMVLTGFHGAHVTLGILWLVSVAALVRLHPKTDHRPIMATMLPKFLGFLSGVPKREPGTAIEARPRHRRFIAFVREQTQAPPPPVLPPDVSVKQFEAHHLAEEKVLNVELVGLYWHFVDIVWVVIFTVVYLFA